MTEQDIRKLLGMINSIFPTFKVENPEQTVKIWTEFLSDQDAASIGASLKNYVRTDTSGFAPSIGQLIQGAYSLQNHEELSAAEAWSKVYKAICNSAYHSEEEFNKLPEVVQQAVGSANQLRAWATDDEFNESVTSALFRKSYATACERKKTDALMPPDVRMFIENTKIKEIEG